MSVGGSQRKLQGWGGFWLNGPNGILIKGRPGGGGSDITWGWWDKKFGQWTGVIRYQGWGILA